MSDTDLLTHIPNLGLVRYGRFVLTSTFIDSNKEKLWMGVFIIPDIFNSWISIQIDSESLNVDEA